MWSGTASYPHRGCPYARSGRRLMAAAARAAVPFVEPRVHPTPSRRTEASMRHVGNSRLLWAAGKYLSAEEHLEQLGPSDTAIAARLRRSIRQTRRRLLLAATHTIQQRPTPSHFRTVLVAVDGEPASRAAWRVAADLA